MSVFCKGSAGAFTFFILGHQIVEDAATTYNREELGLDREIFYWSYPRQNHAQLVPVFHLNLCCDAETSCALKERWRAIRIAFGLVERGFAVALRFDNPIGVMTAKNLKDSVAVAVFRVGIFIKMMGNLIKAHMNGLITSKSLFIVDSPSRDEKFVVNFVGKAFRNYERKLLVRNSSKVDIKWIILSILNKLNISKMMSSHFVILIND